MAPKKRTRAASSSSTSRFDSHQFPSENRVGQFEELFAKRNVGSKREIADNLLDIPVVQLLTRWPWTSFMKFGITGIMVD